MTDFLAEGFDSKRIPVSGFLFKFSCSICHARSSFSGEGRKETNGSYSGEVKGRGKEGGRSLLSSEVMGE